ncbi:MAG TPA: alpha/beta hydrolase [Nitriliruptorales bacterium]
MSTTTERSVAAGTGQTFVFEELGEGPLVVLQHGFPDTPAGWLPTQVALAGAGYRTIAPWLRGYRPENRVAGRGYGPELLGRDLLELLDALGEERAVVVGHDWGALAAYTAAALDTTDRIRGIVAIAIPHPRVTPRNLDSARMGRHFLTFKLPTGPWMARRNDFAYIDTLYRRWSPSWDGPVRERAVAGVKALFRQDSEALLGALSWYREFPLVPPRAVTARVNVPGLVFAGDEDWGGDPGPFRRSCEAFDAPCEVVIVPGAGHWAHLECQDRFTTELLRFLEATPD